VQAQAVMPSTPEQWALYDSRFERLVRFFAKGKK
jgi:hypothetical protein